MKTFTQTQLPAFNKIEQIILYTLKIGLLSLLLAFSNKSLAQLMPATYNPPNNSAINPTRGVSLRYNTGGSMTKGSGNIVVSTSPGGVWENIPVSSASVTLTHTTSPAGYYVDIKFRRPLPDGVQVNIAIPTSAFNASAPNGFGGVSNWQFNTNSSGPIMYDRSPAIGDQLTASPASIALDFHENIFKGSGAILLKNKNTGSVLQSINVTSSDVTILTNAGSPRTAVINLPTALPESTDVILEIPAGVFKDAGNTNSIAVNDFQTWFRIVDSQPPTLQSTSPAHQSTINVTDRVITFTFSEPVIRGTGAISFRNKANSAIIYEAPLYGGDVTQTGNTLTVTKPHNWLFGIQFFVIIPGTAIRDMEGNYWPGISLSNVYNFTTCSSVSPTVSIAITNGTNPTCAGQSQTFMATPTNGGTSPGYQWKVNGANVGTNSTTFTSSTLTNGQIVTCVLTSNATCATSTTATSNNILVGIRALVTPTVTISTFITTVCTNNSVTFNATVTNAGSAPVYQWKVDGANVSINQNFYTTTTLTNGQVVTCVITRDNSGCLTSTTATSNSIMMTVGSRPAQPSVITGNTSVCQGTTLTYSITNVSGVTYLWDAGGAGTIVGSGNSVSVTWNSSGAKTLTIYPINSCGTGTTRTLAVTVGSAPSQPSVIVGATAPGQNQTNQYSVTNEPGTTYTWGAGSGGTVTGSGNAVSILWTTTGAKTITVTPSTSCGSGTARTLSVTVGAACTAPAQPSTITGSATACTASSGTYSVSPVGGVSYTWNAGVDGNVSGSGNSVTLSWTSTGTKTVTVTPFTDCGTGTARTLTVEVSALPVQPSTITGNATACFNSSNTYSVTNVSGVIYAWDTAGKGTVTGSGNSVSVQWTAAGTNSLTVTPSNSCGSSLARTLSVAVSNVPLGTSAITGSNFVCTNSSGTYSIINVSGVSYTWTAGAGGTVTGSGNSVSVAWSTAGVKTLQVTPSNTCGNGPVQSYSITVTAPPAQPGIVTGNNTVNAGITNTYSVPSVTGVAYVWSTNVDGVIAGSGNSVQVTWSTGGTKTLTVTPSNNCGNGTVQNMGVTVSVPCVTPGAPASLDGPIAFNLNQTRLYTVGASSGATSLGLSVSPTTGITITPVSGNQWNVTFTAAGEFIISAMGIVTGCDNGTGNGTTTGPPISLPVSICAGSVSTPTGLTGPTTNVCKFTKARYSVTALPGLTYEWLPLGSEGSFAYLNASKSEVEVTWNNPGAPLIQVSGRNACNNVSGGATLSVSMAAVPSSVSISTSPAPPYCEGLSLNFTITNPQGGVTYSWDLKGPGTVAGNTLSASIIATTSGRSIEVYGSNGCFVNSSVTSIGFGGAIPNVAQPSPVSGPATLDVNVEGTYSVASQPDGVFFSWDAGPNATITAGASFNIKQIRWSTGGTKTISVGTNNSCGLSAERTYSVYVLGPCDAPAIPDPITGGTAGCANLEYIFSVPFQPNTTFNWSAGADATITGTGTTRNIKWSTAGAKTITVSATNGCTTSTNQTKSFTVSTAPAQPTSITGGNLACAGSLEDFSVSPVVGGVSYTWEVQGGTFTTSGGQNQNISITWSSAGTSTIKVKASNTCGFSAERSITRDISTTPLQPSIVNGEAEVCTSTSKSYSITNVTGTTYTWNGGAGGTVTGSGNSRTISWSTAGSKTITVTPSTSCGDGTPRTLNVNVIGVPAQPAAIVGSASPVLGSSVAYSVTNVSGVNYAWSLTDKGILTTTGNTSSVSWNSIGGATLSVSASNLCGVSTARAQAITVNKIPQAITFTLASPVLANAEVIFNGVSDAGLPISYASSNTSVAEVQGNSLVINGTGTINITASQSGDVTYAAATNVVRSITINKANQTITFAALAPTAFGSAPFNAAAYSDSNLPITYASSTPAVATISSDGTISIIGVGSTNINATQGGDARYNSATPVVRALTVNKAAQTIAFEPLAIRNISDPPFSLNGTASSGLALTFTSSNASVAEVSGNLVFIIGNGVTTITASQAGNGNYNAASSVGRTLTINDKQSQTISFSSLAAKTFGDANFNLSASASSGLAVSYASSNTAVATMSGNSVTVVGAGSTTITATQIGDATFNAATPIQQVLVVNKANQTITFSAIGTKQLNVGSFQLAAIASSGLAVSYISSNTSVATVSGTTVTLLTLGTTTISALQAGNTNYNAATAVSQELVVSNKTDQTIAFNSISAKTVGDTPFNLAATASSGLAVSYSTTSNKITLSGSQVTLVSAGRASITASQIGNATFNAAPVVNQSFCINPTKPTVSEGQSGETVTLTSSNTSGNQWFKDGATISGATNVNFDVTTPGVYKVQVTVDDCVSQFSDDVAMVVTGDQASQQVEWKLFPNPAEDKLFITLPGNGTKHVQVIQADGRVLNKVTTDLNEVIVEVNQYAQGIYFVRIQNDKGIFSGRFFKK